MEGKVYHVRKKSHYKPVPQKCNQWESRWQNNKKKPALVSNSLKKVRMKVNDKKMKEYINK